MQRTRNRRRGEREDVGLELQLLETLFVLHAEAVLFVDDNEPEVRELDIGTEQPVRADHEIDFLLFQLDENRRLFFRCLKSAQRRDANRKIGETLGERTLMLIRENGRWH